MLAPMIQQIMFLMNLKLIQSYTFSTLPLDQNYLNKQAKGSNTKLVGTPSRSATIFSESSCQNSKSRGDESKLYYQIPTDTVWIEDTKEDFSFPTTELLPSFPDIADYEYNNILNMKSLATEGKLLVEKMRKVGALINDQDSIKINQECKRQNEHANVKEKYELALQHAKDCDLNYGLCSVESLNAWDIVDIIYVEYEQYYKEGDDNNANDGYHLNDILEMCDLLETTFSDIHDEF